MDEDLKIIEELRENNEYQKAQILHLEKALKQAIAKQEEVQMINDSEIQKCKEVIEDLNKKLANCMSTIDAKNVELLNLQTALGQYFAEIEAKVNYFLLILGFLLICPAIFIIPLLLFFWKIYYLALGFYHE